MVIIRYFIIFSINVTVHFKQHHCQCFVPKFSKDKTIFLYISKNNFTIEDATFLKTRKILDRYITSNISIYCTTNKFISYYRPKYYRLQSKKDKLIAEINVEKDVEAKAAQNVDTAE